MGGYLGYDPCALGVLRGALERALDERIPSRPTATHVARRAVEQAVAAHRRQLAELGPLAEVVGLVLRADPLGAYRPVGLDPRDLDLWAFHRGGRWRTALDPTATGASWDQQERLHNARLVAGWLTPERWHDLLEGDGEAVEPVLHYLEGLADAPAARDAFLDAIGPDRFRSMLVTASERSTSAHLPGATDHPAAERADEAIGALGSLWAVARSLGRLRNGTWDRAALGGPLVAATRVLVIGAGRGALTPTELARWGTAQWRRLNATSPSELPEPVPIGDRILQALTVDGRSARHFLLALGEGPDLIDLTALLSSALSSPPASGALLLASTDPSAVRSAADRDEVRRSVHAVLTVVDHLLAEREAQAPAPGADGRLTGRPGATLPAGLGLYAGRQLVHLVDRCDGAVPVCRPEWSAWPGWEEREVSRLLARLVTDDRTAAELQEAALAGWFTRLAATDLLVPDAGDAVRRETFAVGALDGIVGDHTEARSRIDHERFQAQVAGLDLAIDVVSAGAGRVPRAAAAAWDPVSDAGTALGQDSLGGLALTFLRPEAVADVRARTEAGQALTTARLKVGVATLVVAQAHGGSAPPAATAVQPGAARVAEATRAGDNANAGAYRQLAGGGASTAGEDVATRERIAQLQAVVGDTMAEGRAWVA